MPKSASAYALAILEDAEIRTIVTVTKLQAIAIDQLAAIPRIEREAALRAILCGLTLHRVKASLAHGQFLPWIQKCTTGALLPDVGLRQVRYYMRLAITAVENTKATVPEILALPGDQKELALQSIEDAGRRLMEKLVEFVGDRSLNELLAEHGIKDREAARRRAAGNDEPASEEKAAQTVQDRFNEVAELVRQAVNTATDKALWMSFSRRQHDDLRAIFERATDEVTKIYVKTHGRKTT